MSHPFKHPSSRVLLDRMAQPFKNNRVFISRKKPLIFVCGGSTEKYKRTLRKRFISFSKKNALNYQVFLAEDVNLDIINNDDAVPFINVAEFEEILAGVADCIIVFLESPGSFAEIGYFSKDNAISAKILSVRCSIFTQYIECLNV